ncbi:YgjP-like metallopeptidase domain-containing protein [Cellulomonas soli]
MHPTHDLAQVEVRRSRRRARTVTAWREGERTIVAIPARFTRAQENEWVRRMLVRLAAQERRRKPSDGELAERAAELSGRYLDGRAVPTSVTWSTNQERRWGSCTPSDGTIRISDRVRGMPRWVLDYVLLHELTHLLHAGHGPEFWAELERYPRTARARGSWRATRTRGNGPARVPGVSTAAVHPTRSRAVRWTWMTRNLRGEVGVSPRGQPGVRSGRTP